MDKIIRLYSNINIRLQVATIFLSLVGIFFGIKSYMHVKEAFPEFPEKAETFLNDLYVQIAVAVAINTLVALGIQLTLSRPIQKLTHAMDQLTKNNLDIEVPYQNSKSQLGSMARRVQIFKENALQKRELERKQEEDKKVSEAEKKAMLQKLADDFESHVGKVIEALKNSTSTLRATAKTLGIIVDNTNTKVTNVASATQRSASNVETVASATEQLLSAIEEVNVLVSKSSHIATSAVQDMARANQQVERLSSAMTQIGDVSKLIQDIAEQTNLLALNATIEAARAGEAGKGFAVVASEVKNLATQTGQATEKISSHISALRSEANDVAEIIKNATSTVSSLSEITNSIATCVDQERSATLEISRSVQEASTQTSEVSESIQGVAHAALETDKSAKALMDSVTDLAGFSQELDTRVESFLQTVKKAA